MEAVRNARPIPHICECCTVDALEPLGTEAAHSTGVDEADVSLPLPNVSRVTVDADQEQSHVDDYDDVS